MKKDHLIKKNRKLLKTNKKLNRMLMMMTVGMKSKKIGNPNAQRGDNKKKWNIIKRNNKEKTLKKNFQQLKSRSNL